MTRIPRPLLKLLDETLDEDERVLWQGRPDVWAGLKLTRVAWWVGAPWLAIVGLGIFKGWIEGAAAFLIIIGVAIMGLPLVRIMHDLHTLFVITDRRALILRVSWADKKKTADSTYYTSMDKDPEILPLSGNVGDLNFASGVSTKNLDADVTGRYGFRGVKNVEKVRDLLAGAIAKYA
jgi:hypothetical protein